MPREALHRPCLSTSFDPGLYSSRRQSWAVFAAVFPLEQAALVLSVTQGVLARRAWSRAAATVMLDESDGDGHGGWSRMTARLRAAAWWQALAELAVPTLTATFGSQLLRLMASTMISVQRERLGVPLAGLGLFGLGVP
ncbi:MAG: hypothetical protein M3O70_14030, partial [Actinomycetota bacterium]|nr:hypothetical protein [Actinomycetota bacterium]